MENAARIPVSLPHPTPTQSYWQTPPSPLANLCSTPNLPSHAPYVIIGSGISGASIAYRLLLKKPDAQIVMLEARTACSGATGRNGGHTKASSYRSFPGNVETLGMDEAVRIAALQAANIRETHGFARANGIPCDSKPCRTVDVVYDDKQFEFSKGAVEMMEQVRETGEEVGEYRVVSREEVAKKWYCDGAVGGVEGDAGSISAYGFVMGLLGLCLEKGLNLQTNTPATSLEYTPPPASSTTNTTTKSTKAGEWTIHTPHGALKTPTLILATNGYTASLLPEFQGLIVPLRGQITAQRPGLSLPVLPSTYSFIYSSGYDYMIPRPPGSKHSGDIVIGGGWGMLPDAGASEFGVTDDSALNPAISKHLRECTVEYFGRENWGKDDEEGRVRREWTGIMGTSADGKPFVGRVPGRPRGLWVCASFDGHGMVLCWKCAEGLVEMMGEDGAVGEGLEEGNGDGDGHYSNGNTNGHSTTENASGSTNGQTAHPKKTSLSDWFPTSFRITPERFKVAFQGRRSVKVPVETGNHV